MAQVTCLELQCCDNHASDHAVTKITDHFFINNVHLGCLGAAIRDAGDPFKEGFLPMMDFCRNGVFIQRDILSIFSGFMDLMISLPSLFF